MKLVLQRVTRASVRVDGATIAEIGRGLMILIGIDRGDGEEAVRRVAERVTQLRIFEDDAGKMNRSVKDIGGEVLVVPQFTLSADVRKGARPSFDAAEQPERARALIAEFVAAMAASGVPVREGCFGAHMAVELLNDGPVTFVM